MTARRTRLALLEAAEPDGAVLVDINTTPLIDVMLVLLIMLIITIPVQTHAVRLDMPRGDPPPAAPPPPVVRLDIDFDGTLLWNGAVVPDRAALEAELRALAAQAPQPELHVAPHKLTTYASVAMVLAEAQRLGVTRLGIAGGEAY
jgi:biopolymer transport protein ExbD